MLSHVVTLLWCRGGGQLYVNQLIGPSLCRVGRKTLTPSSRLIYFIYYTPYLEEKVPLYFYCFVLKVSLNSNQRTNRIIASLQIYFQVCR